jgi:hypothetical protein
VNFIFDSSLVLYLPLPGLDGGSFVSRDVYGHVCTVTGALWRPGGHYFDGSDDDIDCGNHSSLNVTTAITLEVWIKLENLNDRTIIGKMQTIAGGRQYVLQIDTNSYRVLLRNSADSGYLNTTNANSTLSTSAWYHLVGSWDGSKVYYYLNGQSDGSPTASGTLLSTTTNVMLGRNQNGTSYLNATIGEARIYSRELTPAEVQHNYLATKWRYQ